MRRSERAVEAEEAPPGVVGVVVALPEEAAALRRRLACHRVRRVGELVVEEGLLGGRGVVLTQSGVGRCRAEAAASALLDAYPLTALCAAGFAGALDPRLRPGDPIGASAVLLVPDPGSPAIRDAFPCITIGHPGLLLTTDRIVTRASTKRALWEWLGREVPPVALDMESAGVAAAARCRVGFAALRVITDAALTDLPLEFERCLGPTGRVQATALAAQLARHPAALPGLVRLGCDSLRAGRRLANFLAAVLPNIP